MRFDQLERSNYDGKPIILYEFALGQQTWRYAATEDDVEFNGALFESAGVLHDGYTMSGDPSADDITIRGSASMDVAKLFINTPPSDSIHVAIRTLHHGDNEAPVVWSGTVKSMKRVSTVEVVFTCNSLLSTLNRNGLRLSWQRGCPHALYDRACSVNPDSYATLAQVSAMTGTSVTVLGALGASGDGYFDGGYISFVSAQGTIERRAVERHRGATLNLLTATDGIQIGGWITVYPGCDRTTNTCLNKFNNLDNYGGFPHLPNKSPFDGDPVF